MTRLQFYFFRLNVTLNASFRITGAICRSFLVCLSASLLALILYTPNDSVIDAVNIRGRPRMCLYPLFDRVRRQLFDRSSGLYLALESKEEKWKPVHGMGSSDCLNINPTGVCRIQNYSSDASEHKQSQTRTKITRPLPQAGWTSWSISEKMYTVPQGCRVPEEHCKTVARYSWFFRNIFVRASAIYSTGPTSTCCPSNIFRSVRGNSGHPHLFAPTFTGLSKEYSRARSYRYLKSSHE